MDLINWYVLTNSCNENRCIKKIYSNVFCLLKNLKAPPIKNYTMKPELFCAKQPVCISVYYYFLTILIHKYYSRYFLKQNYFVTN